MHRIDRGRIEGRKRRGQLLRRRNECIMVQARSYFCDEKCFFTAVGSISKWPNLCRVQDWCEQPPAKRGTPTVKAPRMRSRSYLQVIEDLNAKGMI